MKALFYPLQWILLSLLFTIHINAQTHLLVGYRSSFNGNEQEQYVSITPTQHLNLNTLIDATQLTTAYNILQMSFKDDHGYWSSILHQPVIVVPEGDLTEKNLVAYEYMFNNGLNLHRVPMSPQNDLILTAELDATGLPNLVNVLNIRFQDDSGLWSSYCSQFVIAIPQGTSLHKNIIAYEYAFNDGAFVQKVPISPAMDYLLIAEITPPELTQSLNVFHIRFQDESGIWSSYTSQFYLDRPATANAANHAMTSYAYWFDANGTNKRMMDVNPDTPHLNINEIDVQDLWEGDYTLYMQYRDNRGENSLVTSDNFHKNLHPMALFEVDSQAICEGETVAFTNNGSIDFDTVLWDFGDDITSTDLNTSHTYANEGTYTASFTVTDTESGMNNTSTQIIQVYKVPNESIYTEDLFPACFGTPVTIYASEPEMNYLWSNGSITSSIVVTEAGSYSVTITNPNHNACQVTSDAIEVSFKPEIDASITLQDYPLLLTANESAAAYQWVDCTNGNIDIEGATGVSYEPTVNGDYALEVTKYGCTVTSDCITISTVDIADFGIKEIVKLYPNPAHGILFVSNEIPIQIIIYNANGAKIGEENYEMGVQQLDLKNYQSGLYFAKITALSGTWENQSALYKIIID